MSYTTSQVLVLNVSYEHENMASAKRAITLLVNGKAEVVEPMGWDILTNRRASEIKVVRLTNPVAYKKKPVAFTPKRMYIRDDDTCQYCGARSSAYVKMTIDHVVPRSHGGKTSWDNCVAACQPCNTKKSNMTLEECGMKLRKRPFEPSFYQWRQCQARYANRKTNGEHADYLYMSSAPLPESA